MEEELVIYPENDVEIIEFCEIDKIIELLNQAFKSYLRL